jgi:GH15 family glucan-1,4-alpha-glucosidase
MNKEQKIQKLVEKTKQVFKDCFLPNGCLVAAPTHMPYYPAQAKSYLYCWPGRDLGFNITGALYLGIDVFEQVLNWIWERAEDYKTSLTKWREGLLFKSYYPNGRLREPQFQPDQTGTLLWAIFEYGKTRKLPLVAEKIIEKSTQGLIGVWDKDHFKVFIEDLWEERIAHPRFKNNLTYSLAACSAGLEKANEIIPNKEAKIIAQEMNNLIEKEAYDKESGYFLRRFGGTVPNDKNIDTSMLGLVWPFEIVKPTDPRMINTIKAIEENLTDEKGIYRYKFDEYEGEIEQTDLHYKMGAGAWPLLTFWMSIVQNKIGNREKAEKYFWLVLNQLSDDFLIPEQIFSQKDPRIGVKPLLWSHTMFIHAAKELKYI